MPKFDLKKELGKVKAPKPPIPEGRYTAVLRAVEGDQKTARGKKNVKWRFQILDHPEFKGRTILGWTPGKDEIGTITMEWIEAIVGRPLKADEDTPWDSLPGKRAVIEVETEESYDDPNQLFSKVVAVYPLENPPELIA